VKNSPRSIFQVDAVDGDDVAELPTQPDQGDVSGDSLLGLFSRRR
jgi:hypothetical protein